MKNFGEIIYLDGSFGKKKNLSNNSLIDYTLTNAWDRLISKSRNKECIFEKILNKSNSKKSFDMINAKRVIFPNLDVL